MGQSAIALQPLPGRRLRPLGFKPKLALSLKGGTKRTRPPGPDARP